MADSRKKADGQNKPVEPAHPGFDSTQDEMLSREELDSLSTLQILDLIAGRLPPRHVSLFDLVYLRERIAGLEEMSDQARQALEKFDKVVEKLRSPAFRSGTFLGHVKPDLAMIALGGSEYVCNADPALNLKDFQVGEKVLCNEAFAIVRNVGFDRNGPVVKIDDLLSDGRIRVGSETGGTGFVIQRSGLLAKEKLRAGLEIRLDANQRVALEVIGAGKRIERSLEKVQELPWSSIGGQEDAVKAIRETIELPLLHKELYRRFDHHVPKGFLLYGPPGCGKTLLGKATAYNLRQQIREQTGVDRPEFFLHVKGPEILNMWVGESERQVRDLFSQCRERAGEGALAFLFIDEAESLLGTRRAGRNFNLSSTIVPMFCAEMDGLEPLQNVVVILASNRADLIDPAILRPGRIDRKIRVRRPDQESARRIYEIYLKETLPLAEPSAELARAASEAQYSRTPENEFLEVHFRSGKRDTLHRGDVASGAIIAGIVERAKGIAIRRSISTAKETLLSRADLLQALAEEYRENEMFPATDITEDWLKLTDFDPENVIKLGPVRPRKAAGSTGNVI